MSSRLSSEHRRRIAACPGSVAVVSSSQRTGVGRTPKPPSSTFKTAHITRDNNEHISRHHPVKRRPPSSSSSSSSSSPYRDKRSKTARHSETVVNNNLLQSAVILPVKNSGLASGHSLASICKSSKHPSSAFTTTRTNISSHRPVKRHAPSLSQYQYHKSEPARYSETNVGNKRLKSLSSLPRHGATSVGIVGLASGQPLTSVKKRLKHPSSAFTKTHTNKVSNEPISNEPISAHHPVERHPPSPSSASPPPPQQYRYHKSEPARYSETNVSNKRLQSLSSLPRHSATSVGRVGLSSGQSLSSVKKRLKHPSSAFTKTHTNKVSNEPISNEPISSHHPVERHPPSPSSASPPPPQQYRYHKSEPARYSETNVSNKRLQSLSSLPRHSATSVGRVGLASGQSLSSVKKRLKHPSSAFTKTHTNKVSNEPISNEPISSHHPVERHPPSPSSASPPPPQQYRYHKSEPARYSETNVSNKRLQSLSSLPRHSATSVGRVGLASGQSLSSVKKRLKHPSSAFTKTHTNKVSNEPISNEPISSHHPVERHPPSPSSASPPPPQQYRYHKSEPARYSETNVSNKRLQSLSSLPRHSATSVGRVGLASGQSLSSVKKRLKHPSSAFTKTHTNKVSNEPISNEPISAHRPVERHPPSPSSVSPPPPQQYRYHKSEPARYSETNVSNKRLQSLSSLPRHSATSVGRVGLSSDQSLSSVKKRLKHPSSAFTKTHTNKVINEPISNEPISSHRPVERHPPSPSSASPPQQYRYHKSEPARYSETNVSNKRLQSLSSLPRHSATSVGRVGLASGQSLSSVKKRLKHPSSAFTKTHTNKVSNEPISNEPISAHRPVERHPPSPSSVSPPPPQQYRYHKSEPARYSETNVSNKRLQSLSSLPRHSATSVGRVGLASCQSLSSVKKRLKHPSSTFTTTNRVRNKPISSHRPVERHPPSPSSASPPPPQQYRYHKSEPARYSETNVSNKRLQSLSSLPRRSATSVGRVGLASGKSLTSVKKRLKHPSSAFTKTHTNKVSNEPISSHHPVERHPPSPSSASPSSASPPPPPPPQQYRYRKSEPARYSETNVSNKRLQSLSSLPRHSATSVGRVGLASGQSLTSVKKRLKHPSSAFTKTHTNKVSNEPISNEPISSHRPVERHPPSPSSASPSPPPTPPPPQQYRYRKSEPARYSETNVSNKRLQSLSSLPRHSATSVGRVGLASGQSLSRVKKRLKHPSSTFTTTCTNRVSNEPISRHRPVKRHPPSSSQYHKSEPARYSETNMSNKRLHSLSSLPRYGATSVGRVGLGSGTSRTSVEKMSKNPSSSYTTTCTNRVNDHISKYRPVTFHPSSSLQSLDRKAESVHLSETDISMMPAKKRLRREVEDGSSKNKKLNPSSSQTRDQTFGSVNLTGINTNIMPANKQSRREPDSALSFHKKRSHKPNLPEAVDFDVVKEKIAAVQKIRKVKTTRELIDALNSKSLLSGIVKEREASPDYPSSSYVPHFSDTAKFARPQTVPTDQEERRYKQNTEGRKKSSTLYSTFLKSFPSNDISSTGTNQPSSSVVYAHKETFPLKNAHSFTANTYDCEKPSVSNNFSAVITNQPSGSAGEKTVPTNVKKVSINHPSTGRNSHINMDDDLNSCSRPVKLLPSSSFSSVITNQFSGYVCDKKVLSNSTHSGDALCVNDILSGKRNQSASYACEITVPSKEIYSVVENQSPCDKPIPSNEARSVLTDQSSGYDYEEQVFSPESQTEYPLNNLISGIVEELQDTCTGYKDIPSDKPLETPLFTMSSDYWDKLSTAQIEGITGNFGDATSDNNVRKFSEWHEPVLKRSYKEELLHIMPYVVIDY